MKPNLIPVSRAIKGRIFHNWTVTMATMAILSLVSLINTARAQVTNIIYQDNFARTGVLNGSAPDTINLPGATWVAANNTALNSVLMTDGSEVACTNWVNPTNGFFLNGFLPFTPQVGHVYTVSCQMVALSGGNQWMGMGFATHALTNNYFLGGNLGSEWLLLRGNGAGIQTFRFPYDSGAPSITTAFGTTTNLFSVVMDTTTGNAHYGWTIKFYTNGVQAGASYTVPYGNPPVQYVGLGADAATGYFQQFTLVDAVPHPGAPSIIEQPNNRTAQVGQMATFWVGVSNDMPSAVYQWMTNSSGGPTNAIVGATNATYTTPALNMTYNNLNYSVSVTNAYGATNSALATLTVVSGPPTVYSAKKTAGLTNVVVAFSKAVDTATGLNPANYSLNINGASSGISIVSASYGSSLSNCVILTTSTTLDTNAGYYLTVQSVKDLFGNAMSGTANVPVLPDGLVFFVRGDSGLIYDGTGSQVVQWLDQTTNANNAGQFVGVPSAGPSLYGSTLRPGTSIINNGQLAVDFGTTVHWLQAPSSPSLANIISNRTMYVVANFYTASGNDVLNETWGNLPAPFDWDPAAGENIQYGAGYDNSPANGTGNTIAANTPYVLSSTLALPVSGGATNFNFYLNGNGNGSGNLNPLSSSNPGGIIDGGHPLFIGGRWDFQNPHMKGQIAEILLFNTTLSGADRTNVDNYLGQKYYSFAISQNLPATLTSSNGFSVTYSFAASQGSVHGFSFQWYENGTAIPGATGQSYTTPILSSSDSGETYYVVVTLPNGTTTNSVVNTLTVLNEPPYVTSAGIPIWNTNQVVVLFDEAVDPTTAATVGNYTLNNGATISSAVMGDAPNKVVLTTSALTWNANPGFYSLTVSGVKDLYNNTIVTASPGVGLYPPATALWLKANTAVIQNGTGVNEWDDQSGNANDLFNIAGTEPQVATNATGHLVVRFNGTNATELDAPTAPTLAITGDISVAAVINFATFNGNTNGNTIVSKTGSASAHQANVPAPYDYFVNQSLTGSSTPMFLRGSGSANGSSTATNTVSIGGPQILLVSELGNTVSHVLNGNAAGVGPLSGNYNETNDADAGNDLTIGARADGFTRLTGDITEMILIGSSLSSNDVVSLNNYLSASYGIPLGTNSYAVITQQPVTSTNIGFGATLSVPVGVSGNPLFLQWYDTNGVLIAGQTSATLTINNDQTSDAYYLVATNAFGSVTSSIVSVTVVTGLQVGLGPSVSLYVGQPWTFTAQALGNAPLYYQWYQGASPIPGATNATYTATATLGATSYSCTVTNGYNGYSSTNAGPVTFTGIALPGNAFSQVLLNDQPVAYWRLNEPSGSTIAYDYVGGYNGLYGPTTTNGLPGVPLPGFSGELGVAMDNSATNGFVTTPGLPINTNTVTFLCWAYPFSTQTNSAGLIFYRVNGIVAGYQFANNNVMSYNWNNNPATYDSSAASALPVNTWSLVALTVTSSNAVIYVSNTGGQSSGVISVANPSLYLGPAGFAIGADPQGFTLPSRIFNGKMNEAAIFNYTLSASQIQQLYSAAATGVGLVNTTPTNILFSASGGNLTLSWPTDHTGWQLQAETNGLSVGISSNWVNVANSSTTNEIVIPMNLTNGSVFYRLIYP